MEFAILIVSCITLIFSFASGFTALLIWLKYWNKNKSKEAAEEIKKRIQTLKNALTTTTDIGVQSILNEQINDLESKLKTFSKSKSAN